MNVRRPINLRCCLFISSTFSCNVVWYPNPLLIENRWLVKFQTVTIGFLDKVNCIFRISLSNERKNRSKLIAAHLLMEYDILKSHSEAFYFIWLRLLEETVIHNEIMPFIRRFKLCIRNEDRSGKTWPCPALLTYSWSGMLQHPANHKLNIELTVVLASMTFLLLQKGDPHHTSMLFRCSHWNATKQNKQIVTHAIRQL